MDHLVDKLVLVRFVVSGSTQVGRFYGPVRDHMIMRST